MLFKSFAKLIFFNLLILTSAKSFAMFDESGQSLCFETSSREQLFEHEIHFESIDEHAAGLKASLFKNKKCLCVWYTSVFEHKDQLESYVTSEQEILGKKELSELLGLEQPQKSVRYARPQKEKTQKLEKRAGQNIYGSRRRDKKS